MSADEVFRIADQAVEMGALWCLLTGGEPLLREDFADIYVGLKRRGLLVSVFTNACLVTPEHVALFRRYPPRDIEVSVYGATATTTSVITRRKGSFSAFTGGLDLLLSSGVPVRTKAMALRSNLDEFPAIAALCRERTKDYFRFDPLLHLRLDRNERRNVEIRAERLSPAEVVALERGDAERFSAVQRVCQRVVPVPEGGNENVLFRCGAGVGSFTIGYDGSFRLCSALVHEGTTFNLRAGSLAEAKGMVDRIRGIRTDRETYLERCGSCPIIDLCLWCPAHADLETGQPDEWVELFCRAAHSRVQALQGAD